jgi:hypothetical protein
MPKLSDQNLPDQVRIGQYFVTALNEMGSNHGTDWPEGDGRMLHHLCLCIVGQIERVLDAATTSSVMGLSWATRNLFELTIITDYLCRSADNRKRFVEECNLDSLFMMDKFMAIDRRSRDTNHSEVVEGKRKRLQQRVGDAHPQSKQGSRDTRSLARDIGREKDYEELYKPLSKMSHPTPFAILGGTDESVSWDAFALYVVIRANGYAAECHRHLITHFGCSGPKVG